MALVFTGDEFSDGGNHIADVLAKRQTKASFFLTGNFYENPKYHRIIKKLQKGGHYLGPHSDKHLLYCDWTKRDSLLVSRAAFETDIRSNYKKMRSFGIALEKARFFLPPYEWYNDSIAAWSSALGLTLINFSTGTRTNADYTTPGMKGYRSSDEIFSSVVNYEQQSANGLNGFIMLIHIGTDPDRVDKFYHQLDKLLKFLVSKGYKPVRIDELL